MTKGNCITTYNHHYWPVNKLINDNLEQQAQALFKSWFIDFEPFKDEKFKECESGTIPEEWHTIKFESFITPIIQKVMVGDLPEYSVTNEGIKPRSEKYKKQLSNSTSKNKVLKKNNLVFGMSREILNWGIMNDEIGGVSSAYTVYEINEKLVPALYLKYYIKAKSQEFNSLIGVAAREGQSLDKGALYSKEIYTAPIDVWLRFLEINKVVDECITINQKETTELEMVRDFILPKLMSGELKINEI